MAVWEVGAPGVVVLPDGRRLRGRGLAARPAPGGQQPEHAVHLTGREPAAPAWPSRWVAWPDFRLPRDPADALDALVEAHALAATRAVEVACGGGTGRTGTALAVLARLSGVPADEAVAWVRVHYRPRAAETPAQRRFAARVRLPPRPG